MASTRLRNDYPAIRKDRMNTLRSKKAGTVQKKGSVATHHAPARPAEGADLRTNIKYKLAAGYKVKVTL